MIPDSLDGCDVWYYLSETPTTYEVSFPLPVLFKFIMILRWEARLRAACVGTLPGNRHSTPVCTQHSLSVHAWQFISPTYSLTTP